LPVIAAFLPAAAPAAYLQYASAAPWSKHHTDRRLGGLATKALRDGVGSIIIGA